MSNLRDQISNLFAERRSIAVFLFNQWYRVRCGVPAHLFTEIDGCTIQQTDLIENQISNDVLDATVTYRFSLQQETVDVAFQGIKDHSKGVSTLCNIQIGETKYA